ncbi:APC family permease [Thermogemmatispora sp.]|uniref:APC family permease n=1 Tax=Thermogemmatispora sp. TaxID=1968838 RepID=UPI002ACC1910|nr:amino acid permease [Thermogemmatispora sp.]
MLLSWASFTPKEGSTYLWTHRALGNFWGFFASLIFWMPGLLAMVACLSIGITFIQGLNPSWLSQPWQQGLLCIGLLIISAVLGLRPMSTVRLVVNVITLLTYAVIVLLGGAALIWLVTGHQAATSFYDLHSWSITPSNFPLYGSVVLAYLGADVSMIFGSEMASERIAARHVSWGGFFVILSYLVITFALLVVLGPDAASQGPIAVISVVDRVFGKFVGNLAAVCVIAYFPVFAMLLNVAFARLLMVASIDRFLPVGLSRLNRNRQPSNAIIFQTVVACLCTALIFFLPYLLPLGQPTDLAQVVFNVTLSVLILVWAFSSIFIFVDLAVFYFRQRERFLRLLVVPLPVLWLCIIIAPLACLIAMVVTLLYSSIPQQISNSQWWYIVGGLTVICLVACGIASMFAISQAAWQDQSFEA